MKIHVGTSGYGFKEWKGIFYPEKTSAREMLRFYAERLNAVEINYTFHHMPTNKVLAAWAEQVPDGFSFALKAPQVITHRKRLKNVADLAQWLKRVQMQQWQQAFVFFKHEGEGARGPALAMRFRELARGGA